MDILKTPKELLFEQANILPRFADGGDVFAKNPDDMRAELMVNDALPNSELQEPEEIQEPEVTEQTPELQNEDIFYELRDILNNPGQLPKQNFSGKVSNFVEHLFGPNIFSE